MKIVYLAPIAYDGLKQRPQYFVEELSKSHEVIYVEPTIRFSSCILHRGKEFKGKRINMNSSLSIVRCNGLFVLPFRWNVFDFFGINGLVEHLQLRKVLKEAEVIIVAYEGWSNILFGMRNKKIVYDKMDDNVLLAQTWNVKMFLKRSEKKILRNISCMITTAQVFYDKYKENVKNVYLLPNGVELEGIISEKQKEQDNWTVYGYVGMISNWFDMNAIRLIANMKNAKVILVGPCDIDKEDKLNIEYVGTIPKSEVGRMIQTFDVCLYPFKMSEIIDTINPVKIYEYLALNKPIIAVNSKETKKFGELVYRYRNYEELEMLCQCKLKKPFETQEECEEFINDNSWQSRVNQLNKILEEI